MLILVILRRWALDHRQEALLPPIVRDHIVLTPHQAVFLAKLFECGMSSRQALPIINCKALSEFN
jgi:hypothetical protein